MMGLLFAKAEDFVTYTMEIKWDNKSFSEMKMSTGAQDRREWKAAVPNSCSILQPLKKQNVKIVVISWSNHRFFSLWVLCKYMEPKWINNSLQGEKAVFWDVDYFTVRIFFLGQGH